MKKLLLGTYLIVLSAISMTAQQVVFSVEAPASISELMALHIQNLLEVGEALTF